MSDSSFNIIIKKGATSGSTQPSPGGNGRTPSTIVAQSRLVGGLAPGTTPDVWFAFQGTKMTTDPKPVGGDPLFLVNRPEPVNDYTLIVNLTAPAPQDVAISGGSVSYTS